MQVAREKKSHLSVYPIPKRTELIWKQAINVKYFSSEFTFISV